MQVDPFPVNPCLQAHAYDPLVLMQAAFASHGFESAEHSSISKKKSISVNFYKVSFSEFVRCTQERKKKKEKKKSTNNRGKTTFSLFCIKK